MRSIKSDVVETPNAPSNEQLALFARRLRRIMRDQNGRSHLGVSNGEQEFAFFPDVLRVVEWIERLGAAESEHQARPTLRKAVASTTDPVATTTSKLPGSRDTQ